MDDDKKDIQGAHHCKYCNQHVKSYARHKNSAKHKKMRDSYLRVLEYKLRKR